MGRENLKGDPIAVPHPHPPKRTFLSFNSYFYSIYMGVCLLTCMYVCYVGTWCPQRSEGGCESLGTGVQSSCELLDVGARN